MATVRRILIGLAMTLAVMAVLAAPAAAQTTTTKAPAGAPTVTTEKLSGVVAYVEGNNLVVKMADGEFRTFSNVPDSRKAMIDGKEVGIRDLKPGTKLQATITKTATPVTVRTTTVGSGRVWYVMGTTVILTLPSGENKQYTVKPDYKFTVNGAPATVYDLRQGMTVSAEKIVEEPKVEMATNSQVVGQAPTAEEAAAATKSVEEAKAAKPAAAAEKPAAAPAAAPAKLPKTGGPVPLMSLLGLLFVGGAGVIRKFRQ